MRMILGRALLALVTAVVATGCAPGLGKEIPVTRFPAADEVVNRRVGGARVLVRAFTDGRPEYAVAMIDGRSVSPASDVAGAVRAAFESYLKAAGFTVGGIDSAVLTGTVQRWRVDVQPEFPTSKAEAAATIAVEVLSPTQEVLFRGTYKGEFIVEHPLMDESRIAQALGQAMAAAIGQALGDPRFTSALAAGSR